MGNLKLREFKDMTSAPEIFVKTWLRRKKHAQLIHMCGVYMLLYWICITKRGIAGNKKEEHCLIYPDIAHRLDLIRMSLITFKIKEESSW